MINDYPKRDRQDQAETLIGKNYYGSVPESVMNSFNRTIKDVYWKDALGLASGFLKEKSDWLTGQQKINFLPYIDLKKEDKVLDLGAGGGVISEGISKKVKDVVALEKGRENAEFLKIRFAQDRLNNITVIRGDALDLPFKDGTFNTVIMNGVFEWLPNADISVMPEVLQLKGLKEAYRVLKNNGQLYIGIENRFYYAYFFGAHDPHCGLSWVTILPRFLARQYSILKKKIPYFNYLYSRLGYAGMLKKANFSDIKFYWPYPSYNKIEQIIPLEKNVLEYYLKDSFFPGIHFMSTSFKNKLKFILIRFLPREMLIFSFSIISKKC